MNSLLQNSLNLSSLIIENFKKNNIKVFFEYNLCEVIVDIECRSAYTLAKSFGGRLEDTS